MLQIRTCKQEDVNEFAELILLSAPYFPQLFGKRVGIMLQKMFIHPVNLFSFRHSYFAIKDDAVAGMILAYDRITKTRENLNTGLLMFGYTSFYLLRKMPVLLRMNKTTGKLNEGDYYISNLAVFPAFRNKGIACRLVSKTEEDAAQAEAQRMVIDVEHENTVAIQFYTNLGFRKINDFTIKLGHTKFITFDRMKKNLSRIAQQDF